MASLRARLINSVLRHWTKRRLAACATPLEARKVFQAARLRGPPGVRFRPDSLGGVPGEWAQTKGAGLPRATLLYLHGGGYIGMSAATHRAMTGAFARRGFRVFAANYRLAPEHPFPGAVEDATTAWRGLLKCVDGPVYVAGDSAGGGLALALMMALRDKNERGPDAACLFSPWTDLAVTGESVRTNESRDPLLIAGGIKTIAAAYLNGADPRTPLASPLYGNFAGLPALLFFIGDTEILLDDTLRAAERARAAGVPVELRVAPHMPHVWPFMNRVTPEGRRAMDEAAAFLLGVAQRATNSASPVAAATA